METCVFLATVNIFGRTRAAAFLDQPDAGQGYVGSLGESPDNHAQKRCHGMLLGHLQKKGLQGFVVGGVIVIQFHVSILNEISL
jgi:hypothetical protein